MNICLHCAKRWHRNPSDMWWTSTFKIGLRKIAILMCEQKLYPIRLHVNGRNDSQHCWPTMLGVVAPFAYACCLKFDLFQTLHNNSEKPATACKRVCKRTQSVTSNNVGNCWSTMLCPFARTGLTASVTSPPPSRGQGLSGIACIRMCTCMNRIQDYKLTNYPAMNFLFKVNLIAR